MNRHFLAHVFLLAVFLASLCSAQKLLRRGFPSKDLKNRILAQHNKLRNSIAAGNDANLPAAQNMMELVWDDELAARAQKWADKCVYDNEPSVLNKKGQQIGQNIAILPLWYDGKLQAPRVESLVQVWIDELKNVGYSSTPNPAAGHYWQMVWGETSKIGCGYVDYLQGQALNQYLVCNYFPSGNVQGAQAYEKGSVDCAENNLFPSSNYDNLCTISEELINSCSAN